ncbi:cyclic GMP-AMP synthase DncV-like nucleotidyltransferase [Deinococcus oregonensis]|uniref:Cyclic GMP-AMP synthase n=1 Tax=Deinococcus oregonensis TaxID=1805970 RepID=A0ABV6B7S8_9DEIO
MADVQKQYGAFVEKIKLSEEEDTLRDKRRTVTNALRAGLKRDFEARGLTPPEFKAFNQGSYSLKTGIKPAGNSNDYDIDVGIVFAERSEDHKDDPVKLKRWVRDALDGHTDSVKIKTPCVTVTYKAGYHVDLAVYAHPEMRIDVELPLSWGKEHATTQEWQINYPSELARQIKGAFPDKTERRQFRRVLRALKRWRDLKYKSATSHAAPVGVGLTIAGLTLFRPQVDLFNGTEDDRTATEIFVRNLLSGFRDGCWSTKDQAVGRRLKIEVPFAPRKDVFERINNTNMKKLEDFLKALRDDLQEANAAETNKKACQLMRKQFGDDFPEGDDEPAPSTEGSKSRSKVIVDSHTSG